MIGFCPLASGSKGNCLFIGSKNTRLLIDAGLSLKMTEERLSLLGISLKEIDAILITHEHTDHIKGVSRIAVNYNIPVFANCETAKAIYDTVQECPRFKIFSTGEPFEFGDIEIHPFSIQHDTLDPVAFTFFIENHKIGVCADLGFVTSLVKNQLKKCDFLYIESNHEPSMVHASSRPVVYKQRVLSRQGHLSNQECAELLKEVVHPLLKHIHLAHLSQECNHPDLALKIAQNTLEQYNYQGSVSIAFQDKISKPLLFSPQE